MTKYGDLDSVRDDIIYGEAYVSAELEVYIKKVFDEAPAADVAPVVHGKWESVCTTYWKWKPDGAHPVDRIIYRCSECNRRTAIKTSYCPNCGAKMDLED